MQALVEDGWPADGEKARRLLHMVTEKYDGGSLSRIDANRHLFFPSTAQALHHRRQIQQQQQQQSTAQKEEEKAPPQKEDYGDVLPLPPSKLRFEPPPSDRGRSLELFPFGGGGGGRILCIDEAGGAILHDADASTVQAMPSLPDAMWMCVRPASFAVNHGANAADPAHPDALYVLDGVRHGFQALVYGDPTSKHNTQPPYSDRLSPWFDPSMYSGSYAWHWRQLPPPPVDGDRESDSSFQSYTYADRDSFSLQSHALLHGSTICASFVRHRGADPRSFPGGTYCFDTVTDEWTKAGNWTLPFFSRALHVPELGDGLLFGLHGLNFCAVDVSDAMKHESAAPVLRHEWADVQPPPPPREWRFTGESVAYLGAGRFCIHRGFEIMEQFGWDWDPVDTVTMLTGVEVVPEAAGSSKLRLVRHKTKRVEDPMHHLL